MDISSIQKPYLFSDNGIGDAYIQLPMLRAFNHTFKGRLTILTSEFNKNLYVAENFGNIVTFKSDFIRKNDTNSYIYDLNELTEALYDADFFVDTNSWYLKGEGYENFIRSRDYPTIGFFDFFKHVVFPDYSINSFDLSFNLAKKINDSLKIEEFAYPPKISAKTDFFLDQVKAYFNEDIILIGIQDSTKKEKMWLPENFETLINLLLAKYSNVAFIILGKETTINISHITEKERVLSFGRSLDFESLNGLITILDYFIGIDSVFLHLADLHRVPSIGIFGPTSPIEWGLRFTRGSEIAAKSGNINDIPVSKVLDVLTTLFENHS